MFQYILACLAEFRYGQEDLYTFLHKAEGCY